MMESFYDEFRGMLTSPTFLNCRLHLYLTSVLFLLSKTFSSAVFDSPCLPTSGNSLPQLALLWHLTSFISVLCTVSSALFCCLQKIVLIFFSITFFSQNCLTLMPLTILSIVVSLNFFLNSFSTHSSWLQLRSLGLYSGFVTTVYLSVLWTQFLLILVRSCLAVCSSHPG